MGDFPPGTSKSQKIPWEPNIGVANLNWASKDSKCDIKGRRLFKFWENNSLIILNGITPSDLNGHFTFVGVQGFSVIDYAIVYGEIVNLIKYFHVIPQRYSDH